MSDSDEAAEEVDEIRARKREELRSRAGDGTTQTPDDPVHVDDESHFRRLVDDHDVVLVDFYADWCGPCKMLEPTVAALAEETDAAVAKVDVDAQQGLAQQYRVQGVPTLYLFVDGEPADQMVGVQDKGTLERKIADAGA